jgi:hypothetical protein
VIEDQVGKRGAGAAGADKIASGKMQQVGHGTGGQAQGSVASIADMRLGGTTITGVQAALSSEVKAFEIGLFDNSLGVPLWKAGAITRPKCFALRDDDAGRGHRRARARRRETRYSTPAPDEVTVAFGAISLNNGEIREALAAPAGIVRDVPSLAS